MWLLVGGVAKVEVKPRPGRRTSSLFLPLLFVVVASYLEPPTMGIAVTLSSIAAAIPLRW